MSKRILKKSVITGVGVAPQLKLPPYLMPPELRKVLNNHIKPFPKMNLKHEMYLSAVMDVVTKKDLEPSTYIKHLKLLLYIEEYYRELEMRLYALKNQKISKCGSGNEFLVYVPGLTKDRPSLQLYYEVGLSKTDNSYSCISFISFIGQEFVKIIASKRFSKMFSEDHLFNIRFLLPRRTMQCCHYALELIHIYQLVPAMFPNVRSIYNKLSKTLTWFDKNIASNMEQKQAICNIVARTAHPAPYILFGPPGTGKTATLVEAISQIWKINPSNNILVCAPSNAAADEILKRLLKNIPKEEIHRIYGSSRNWEDVDEKIQPCSNFIDEEKIFLPKDLLMMRRIVVVTLISCTRLLALKLRENHFSYVFIDEGGQATEPETLIPLCLMSSADSSHKGRLQGQLVIAGDPMQLGPSIATKNINILEKSMLERLMEQCLPYKKDMTGKYNPKYITKLVRNFRSNKCILHVPNSLFYDGELIECGKTDNINRAVNCSILPTKSFPLIFHSVVGEETREANSPSVCNMEEVRVLMKYLENLIGSKVGGRKLKQKDIGVITPFKLQRIKIEHELERRSWNDVSVGTVEIFQGQERDVIILSTVRSVLFCHNGKDHLGFLSNPKRFNVAVTRAKSLLVVIGNPTILQLDNCWNELMNYCNDNKALIGGDHSKLKKLTCQEKRKLYAKKYLPKQVVNKEFQFPDIHNLAATAVGKTTFSENFETSRRKPRMPKINDCSLSLLSQFKSDSRVTNTSNSSSITDSELRYTANNFSSINGTSSPSKSNGSSSICENCDEPLETGGFIANKSFASTSFEVHNLVSYLNEKDEIYNDILDNSDESMYARDHDDTQNLMTALNRMCLIYTSSFGNSITQD